MGSIVSLIAQLMRDILRDGHATAQTTCANVVVVSLQLNKIGGETLFFYVPNTNLTPGLEG
jgi:hypothetical protein